MLTIVAPVIVHGIYDSILFAEGALVEMLSGISEGLAGIVGLAFIALFIYFCFKMWKFGSMKIQQHIENDNNDEQKAQEEFNELFKNN